PPGRNRREQIPRCHDLHRAYRSSRRTGRRTRAQSCVSPATFSQGLLEPAKQGARMSDYLGVAGVSATLRSLLTTALTSGGPSSLLGSSLSAVTSLSPDLIKTGAQEQPQLNLFMYYANINSSLRNLDLPSMNGQGNRLSNPPLALNLHYLITAYG